LKKKFYQLHFNFAGVVLFAEKSTNQFVKSKQKIMQEYKLTKFNKKPTKRVERYLKGRDAKVIENTKKSIELYGKNTSETIKSVLAEFVTIF
jgi:hypothetical protein